MHFWKHYINFTVSHAGECWVRMRGPWVIFHRTDFPSIYSIPKHYPHTPPWEERKHPKGQIQHVLCKGPAGDSGGFWSLNKTGFLWCWSSGSLDSGATTGSCDTGSAHPETRVQHPNICFRALIGFGFPVSEVSSELEILCIRHRRNSVLDGFHTHLVIHGVSTRTVSLGTHHNPISLGSANAIIQKWIVLQRFQEFSPVCVSLLSVCVCSNWLYKVMAFVWHFHTHISSHGSYSLLLLFLTPRSNFCPKNCSLSETRFLLGMANLSSKIWAWDCVCKNCHLQLPPPRRLQRETAHLWRPPTKTS